MFLSTLLLDLLALFHVKSMDQEAHAKHTREYARQHQAKQQGRTDQAGLDSADHEPKFGAPVAGPSLIGKRDAT
jgi:hypothetical protein